MVTKVNVFGSIKLIKVNPWTSQGTKMHAIVNAGLAKPKKSAFLASPPPWFFDKRLLSPAQRAVNDAFRSLATGRGVPLKDRIYKIKSGLSGKKFK